MANMTKTIDYSIWIARDRPLPQGKLQFLEDTFEITQKQVCYPVLPLTKSDNNPAFKTIEENNMSLIVQHFLLNNKCDYSKIPEDQSVINIMISGHGGPFNMGILGTTENPCDGLLGAVTANDIYENLKPCLIADRDYHFDLFICYSFANSIAKSLSDALIKVGVASFTIVGSPEKCTTSDILCKTYKTVLINYDRDSTISVNYGNAQPVETTDTYECAAPSSGWELYQWFTCGTSVEDIII